MHEPTTNTPRAGAPLTFTITLRVYWEDTDAGGVVYYANYLKYFERARSDFLRHCGVMQQQLREATGAIFVVSDAQVQYRQPARLDDLVDVSCEVREARGASLVFAQQARRGDALLASATIRAGCVDAGTFRPRRIPTAVLQALSPA